MLQVLLSFGGIDALIPLIIIVIIIGAAAGLTRKFDFLEFLGISTFLGAGRGFGGRGAITGKTAYGRRAGSALSGSGKKFAGKMGGKTVTTMLMTRVGGSTQGAKTRFNRNIERQKALGTTKELQTPKPTGKGVNLAVKVGRGVALATGTSWIVRGIWGESQPKNPEVHKNYPGLVGTKAEPGYVRHTYRSRAGGGLPEGSAAGAGGTTPKFFDELSDLKARRPAIGERYNKQMALLKDRYDSETDPLTKRKMEREALRLRNAAITEDALVGRQIVRLEKAKDRWESAMTNYRTDPEGLYKSTNRELTKIQHMAYDKGKSVSEHLKRLQALEEPDKPKVGHTYVGMGDEREKTARKMERTERINDITERAGPYYKAGLGAVTAGGYTAYNSVGNLAKKVQQIKEERNKEWNERRMTKDEINEAREKAEEEEREERLSKIRPMVYIKRPKPSKK